MTRCVTLPTPVDAMLSFPGLAFAYTMNSGTVLVGTDGLTIIANGMRMRPATGAISLTKLKLSLSYSVALLALVL